MSWLPALAALVLMEPVTYAAHRWVMHGAGMVLHGSHHEVRDGGWEANDLFPVAFAGAAVVAIAAGFNVRGLAVLVPVVWGVAAYGLAYGFVHDVYIHGRLPWRVRIGVCERLRAAHRIHHLWGGEPYGMLVPIVPRALRERAARLPVEPFSARPARTAARATPALPADAAGRPR